MPFSSFRAYRLGQGNESKLMEKRDHKHLAAMATPTFVSQSPH
jgi:hypothetical protein